jgi:hypothetical protein
LPLVWLLFSFVDSGLFRELDLFHVRIMHRHEKSPSWGLLSLFAGCQYLIAPLLANLWAVFILFTDALIVLWEHSRKLAASVCFIPCTSTA